MPALKNARHERFAQELAKGETADAAYVAAGFKANRGNAATLKANQSVKDRVEELQGRAAEKAEWTAADRLIMLQAIAMNSLAVEPRVSVAAIAEANKMQGSHAPVKQDLTSSDGSMAPPSLIQIVPIAPKHDRSADPAS